MALQASISSGQSRATSIQKMKNLVDYGLGIGQAATCVTYGDLATKLNLVATALALPTFDPANDNAGTIRTKINAINTALGLDSDLDVSYDAALSRYWASGGPLTPASQITDTHPQSILVPDGAGGWVSRGVNVLSDGPLGLQTVPTRTNSIRNNSNTGVVAGTPGTMPTNWDTGSAAGLTREIVGTGTEKGVPYIDLKFSGTTVNAGPISIVLEAVSIIAATVGQVWNFSTYCKMVAAPLPPTAVGFRLLESNSGGSTIGTQDMSSAIVPIDALERFSASFTTLQATVAFVRPVIRVSVANATAYDFTIRIAAPQLELGAFTTPPILTTSAAVTRTGNQPKITGLTSQLASGVAGFIKLDLKALQTGAAERIIEFDDGTSSNRFTLIPLLAASAAGLRVLATSGGVAVADYTVWLPALGQMTIVFACGLNFIKARAVGQTDIAADLSGAYPVAMNQIGIGCTPFNVAGTGYQLTQKLALKFGTQNQASFDAMYVLAAAA